MSPQRWSKTNSPHNVDTQILITCLIALKRVQGQSLCFPLIRSQLLLTIVEFHSNISGPHNVCAGYKSPQL